MFKQITMTDVKSYLDLIGWPNPDSNFEMELQETCKKFYNKALEDAISIILKDDVSSLMQAESEIKNLKIV